MGPILELCTYIYISEPPWRRAFKIYTRKVWFLTVRPLKNRNRGPCFQEPDSFVITEHSMSLKNFYRLIFMSIISNITKLKSDPPATNLVK